MRYLAIRIFIIYNSPFTKPERFIFIGIEPSPLFRYVHGVHQYPSVSQNLRYNLCGPIHLPQYQNESTHVSELLHGYELSLGSLAVIKLRRQYMDKVPQLTRVDSHYGFHTWID